ncbi:DUF6153 family protein [Streptomyces virginiae]|nr:MULTISPECIES: DUF6153 family protein [Streptomyces]MCX5277731.1 DUF6153 family protein [Streptomyces virginiae]MCX5583078.1 DUF6153 family protein [Streptomyces erythrochromogenes]
MSAVDKQTKQASDAFGLRSRLLLVLAVLTGLLAMHGLGPDAVPMAAPASASHHATASEQARAAHGGPLAASEDHGGCLHADNPAPGGGHAEHADATCAATGTSGAPLLPAPALAPGAVQAAAPVLHGVPGTTACGRAPPSLSELQLLRI